MNHIKWDKRFLQLAEHVSTWSKDPSTKCGAVIADSKNRIISLGYNGFPRGIDDLNYHDRKLKYEKVLHSECNALLFAKGDVIGCTMYVYPMPPCSRCMSMIIQSGIIRIVSINPNADKLNRWGDSFKISSDMANEVNLKIDFL